MKVVMFPNRYKDKDNKPDYVLYVSKDSETQASPSSEKDSAPMSEDKKSEIPDSLV